ncbi:FAD-binding 8 - like 7 [Theobroma cacao]|nr:FAD-binding 8 - like 7 [Theobroma cacao]
MLSKKVVPENIMKMVRAAIKLFLVLVFLAYMVLWIMMPTNLYFEHWMPEIRAKTKSTYFGNQGASMLIYTFPILFIATMGCIYLHLGKKDADHNRHRMVQTSRLATLKQPAIVRGPLGIVSWMELSFLTMFVALLVWSTSSYLNHMFVHIDQMAAKSGLLVWEAKLEMSGLALGLVGNICLAFLFFPVTRGSSVLRLIGLTSEASVKYHIWIGHIAMTIFTAHGLCFIIFWAKTKQMSEVLKWDKVDVSNVAGEIALVSGLAMWATSLPQIRRKMFELFYYTHHLYILFVVFFVFHVGFSYSCIMLPGFYLFLIDRCLRFLQSQQRISLVSARILPCETVELNFSKSPELSYTPTSMVFVNVRGISKLQWHPFTITSSSNMNPDKLSIVIKSEGSWSSELYQKLSSPSPIDHLEGSIEGPYGPASTPFLRHLAKKNELCPCFCSDKSDKAFVPTSYQANNNMFYMSCRHDTLVMLSGGSGFTPLISIIRELLFKASSSSDRIPQIFLICAFKKSIDLTMLELLLPVSGATVDISCLKFQIEAYVTRDKEPATDNRRPLQNVWFKPNALDAPVSAILGPNSWLWFGVIISSSFVIFLLLLGILTRYYIYPIDHNTGMIYAGSARAALNMLFLCTAIAMTVTAVFLWSKKQNGKGTRQIQSMDTPPKTSPAWFHNADRELESLPHQSLLQATKVHYGERPDLKKILFERKGTSVGVIVSGPREMRQEVAAICSSGLADNLHFESISFVW